MNAFDDYPRSRAFARLERSLAKLYPKPHEYEQELADHIAMFFALGRTQGFAVASQAMSELAEHYADCNRRPWYWERLSSSRE